MGKREAEIYAGSYPLTSNRISIIAYNRLPNFNVIPEALAFTFRKHLYIISHPIEIYKKEPLIICNKKVLWHLLDQILVNGPMVSVYRLSINPIHHKL